MKRIGMLLKAKKLVFLGIIPILFLCLSIILCPKPDLYANKSFSWAIRDRNSQLLWLSLSEDQKYRFFVPLDEIAKELIDATILYEDKSFYSHIGINFLAVGRAVFSMAQGGRRLGASTITMQLVRLVEDCDTSTIHGKLYQMWRALVYEFHYSKHAILEAYLNLAPYGANVEGVGAGSFVWFHKNINEINMAEAIALATIPQNPVARSPLKKETTVWDNARKRLHSLWDEKFPSAYNALYASLPLKIYTPKNLPFQSPHAVMELYAERDTYFARLHKKEEKKQEIQSTIDINLQNALQRVLQNYLADKKKYGLENASVLLANWQTGEIECLLGSADFYNTKISGQIDGTKAKRSPGSTLKPFIYALALQQGLIHSKTILLDTKRNFAGYQPENADGEFQGPIPADKALALSRNIPAIYLAGKLNNPDLYDFLQNNSVDLPKSRDHYGLALVLGGAEISLRDLATLYAMLANNGIYRPLTLYKGEERKVTQALKAEATYITLKMLETKSPLTYSSVISSWKTGTSNGQRDALCAGIIGKYVLITWIGNFDASPNPNFVGAKVALPLYFLLAEKIQELQGNLDRALFSKQDLQIKEIPVCLNTGDVDITLCPDMPKGKALFIPGISLIKNTGVLREIIINTKTGFRECYEIEGVTKKEVYEFWSNELQKLFDKAGIYKKPIPPFTLHCLDDNASLQGKAPQIESPVVGVNYQQDSKNSQKIALIANLDADASTVHWFLDKNYLGASSSNSILYISPTVGKHNLIAVDEYGRSSRIQVIVEKAPF